MTPLNNAEKAIYDEGERLIPGLTHDLEEVIRHCSSYLFFRQIIENDRVISGGGTVSIVDLGCGVGHGTRTLSEILYSVVTGVDMSKESLEYARGHYSAGNIRYEQADLTEFESRMPQFDYAVARNVIEHIRDGLKMVKSLRWEKRLIFDVPYAEPKLMNIHHHLTGITEETFATFDEVEFFYQDLSGCIYNAKHKPVDPVVMICVLSNPALPELSASGLGFDASGKLCPMHLIKKEDCLYPLFPLVSVITPAYNRASYLDETIRSVLAQNYPRIEHIVLDDGSTDNTREVLEKYTGQITWESHPNMGETKTVNKGWGMAHGDIVTVVNSDDILLPGAIGAAAAFMQAHPDVLVAYPDWDYLSPDSRIVGHYQVREYDFLYMLRRHYCTPGPGAFIRRGAFELAGMRNPEFRYVADFEYWLELGLVGKFARIPKTLAAFRVHPGSATVSHRGALMANEHITLVRKFYSRPDLSTEVLKVRAEAFAWAHWVAGVTTGPNRLRALKHYLIAIGYHPRSFFTNLSLWQSVASTVLPKPVFELMLRVARRAIPVAATLRNSMRRS